MMRNRGHRVSCTDGGAVDPGLDELSGAENSTQMATDTATILQAIKDTKLSLESQIAAVMSEVGLFRDHKGKLLDRSKVSKDQISNVMPQVADLIKKCAATDKKLQRLGGKIKDKEVRSQHHNIRLVGVPEKAEGPSIKLFVEEWLEKTVL
ncbi:hypothetical protein NDU88_006804 [Pleurodeles waltl]|uniref:Uncharacterized protein n=1 Tax=Pleurodeles waltl TaxID=8319 RepID=A0AAV7VQN6_PLEWA|nr:hypothetical protein NDU88_006804 [Pleurodeles waltl]